MCRAWPGLLVALSLGLAACSRGEDPACHGAKLDAQGKCHGEKGQYVKDACCAKYLPGGRNK